VTLPSPIHCPCQTTIARPKAPAVTGVGTLADPRSRSARRQPAVGCGDWVSSHLSGPLPMLRNACTHPMPANAMSPGPRT